MRPAPVFRQLHHGSAALLLPNVWDASSARAFAAAGFPALATSSSAMAATLGYEDGERTPSSEMFAAVSRIAQAVDVPVSADIEAGYGLEPGELLERLLEAGVVGCNVEDSDPATGALKDVERHADWLATLCAAAGEDLFVNARVDVFLRGTATEEAISRGRRYAVAGAGCVYPILAPVHELRGLMAAIGAPINALSRPDTASISQVAAEGVARITFGGGLHRLAITAVERLAHDLAVTRP